MPVLLGGTEGLGAESQGPPELVAELTNGLRVPKVLFVTVTVWLGGEFPTVAEKLSCVPPKVNDGPNTLSVTSIWPVVNPSETVTLPEYVPGASPAKFAVAVIVLMPKATTGLGEADAESQGPPDMVSEEIERGRLPW